VLHALTSAKQAGRYSTELPSKDGKLNQLRCMATKMVYLSTDSHQIVTTWQWPKWELNTVTTWS